MSTTQNSLPDASLLAQYKSDLISGSAAAGALRFGSFELKSGRISPYFFNSGYLSSGSLAQTLSLAYAGTIVSELPIFDVLFGPAYKGIPFAAVTALSLHVAHGVDVGYAFNRKEAKAHGEGGSIVGAALKGKRVLVLDDVMTSGKAVREALDIIRAEGAEIVGVVVMLDREEVGQGGKKSTVMELEAEVNVKVRAVLKMRDLIAWLETQGGKEKELEEMKVYWLKYGIKEETASS